MREEEKYYKMQNAISPAVGTLYQNQKLKEEYLKDLNSHLPLWIKDIVELYKSDLKYKIRRETRTD